MDWPRIFTIAAILFFWFSYMCLLITIANMEVKLKQIEQKINRLLKEKS